VGVELAVLDARPRRHALHVAGPDHRAGAEAVLVLERSLEHVRQDLHVAVAVRAEAGARLHAVVVDHTQRAEAHVLRVVVVPEREGVAAVEPAELRAAALVRRSDLDHRNSPSGLGCRGVSGASYAAGGRSGSFLSRLPVAANTAFAIAGAIAAVPGSPRPPGGSLLFTSRTSIAGASSIRRTR